MSQIYPARLEADENGTTVITFPDVPGAVSYGEDEVDAINRGRGALIAFFDGLMDLREEIPSPSKLRRGQPRVVLPPLVASKLGLYQALQGNGLRKADLARRLAWNPRQVDRLFDLTHASRHEQIDQALAALGKELRVSVESAT